MGVADDIYAEVCAIQNRWPLLSDNQFRWRIGRSAFNELVEEFAGPPSRHALDDLGPEFAAIAVTEDARRAERLKTGREAWGKVGSSLLGIPVVCDEDFDGCEPEVVLRPVNT